MSIPSLVGRVGRHSQRLLLASDLPQIQQQHRQLFGDFFKKVKSEAGSNEELQKAVSELKKTGASVRERAKAASKVVESAAAASTEAAKAAAQQAQKQASEVSAAVRSRVTEATKQETPAQQPRPAQSSAEAKKAEPGTSKAAAEAQPASASSAKPDQRAAKAHAKASASAEGPSGSQQQQQQQQERKEQESTSTGQAGAETDQNAAGGDKSSSRQRAAAAGLLARVRNAADVVRREVMAAVLPDDSAVSATRAVDVQPRDAKDATTSSALMAAPVSRFQKQWQDLHDKLGAHPIFQKFRGLRDTRIFKKGSEMAEDMRERWETSDSRMVQRIQDMKDSMFTETETAAALREIRARDPRFDMVVFLQRLKKDVPVLIKGSLEGNAPLLKEHCAPEMVERFTGIFAAQQAQGKFFDSTVLDWSDVELVDLKFLDAQPVVLVQFTVQQLDCIRDKHGNVVEGDPNSVQRVYYYWALQQDDAGFVGVDGKAYPPRWQLREQVVRAMHNLL